MAFLRVNGGTNKMKSSLFRKLNWIKPKTSSISGIEHRRKFCPNKGHTKKTHKRTRWMMHFNSRPHRDKYGLFGLHFTYANAAAICSTLTAQKRQKACCQHAPHMHVWLPKEGFTCIQNDPTGCRNRPMQSFYHHLFCALSLYRCPSFFISRNVCCFRSSLRSFFRSLYRLIQ